MEEYRKQSTIDKTLLLSLKGCVLTNIWMADSYWHTSAFFETDRGNFVFETDEARFRPLFDCENLTLVAKEPKRHLPVAYSGSFCISSIYLGSHAEWLEKDNDPHPELAGKNAHSQGVGSIGEVPDTAICFAVVEDAVAIFESDCGAVLVFEKSSYAPLNIEFLAATEVPMEVSAKYDLKRI